MSSALDSVLIISSLWLGMASLIAAWHGKAAKVDFSHARQNAIFEKSAKSMPARYRKTINTH
jgi:hypothetical protein